MSTGNRPEIVAPGGNIEKLLMAYKAGADAVYVGGPVFGLRKYSDNFSLEELKDAVQMARDMGRKLYVVLNGFARSGDLKKLDTHLLELEAIQPHAFIVSDLGVLRLVHQLTTVPVHLSTQASVTQLRTVNFWKSFGVKRIVLAREVSLADAATIRKASGMELEVFIHGAMCASYSGKCVISNYTSGRDSNRGGCIQTCRHKFGMPGLDAHIMNAKDLNGSALVKDFIEAGIDAVKIEGRMKSSFYVSTVVSSYRRLIDAYFERQASNFEGQGSNFEDVVSDELDEAPLHYPSNRGFEVGGLNDRPGGASISYDFNGYNKQYEFVGTVERVFPLKSKGDSSNEDSPIQQDVQAWAHLKAEVRAGDPCFLFSQGKMIPFDMKDMYSISGNVINKSKPDSYISTKLPHGAEALAVIVR